MALTQKQEAFCLAYIETGNASEAYRRAYDTGKMKPESVNRLAKQLMDNVKIASRIDELRAPALEKALVTVEYIIENLKEVVERSLQKSPVYDMRGKQVQDEEGRDVWRFDSQGANKALELLGKYRGMFIERKEISSPGGGPLEVVISYGDEDGEGGDDSDEGDG